MLPLWWSNDCDFYFFSSCSTKSRRGSSNEGWKNSQRKDVFFILRESDTFGEGRTTSRTILKTLSACIRRNGDTKRKSGSSRTKGNPGERSKIIFWNVRGCSRTIERKISGTAPSLKDKRRTSRTHPDLLQAQQSVICLPFIESNAHIRAVLIAPQQVSIKHRSRSSFASPFTSTSHHYGLFWSTHNQLVLASRIIQAAATLGRLLPVHIWLGKLLYSYIFFNPSIQYVKSSL